MKVQKYILKAFFKSSQGYDFEIIPIFETSKEEVIKKLNENMRVYKQFTLYNFDWDTSDVIEIGFPEILTVSEFWGESGYV